MKGFLPERAIRSCSSILLTQRNYGSITYTPKIGIRLIDLRSDTVTKPTEKMRVKMRDAQVGDDVYGEDPTVNILEKELAKLFQKERALFFPSGTMSNLVAILSWCNRRGSEVILGDRAHIHKYEQGGLSQFGGISCHTLPNAFDGTFDITAVESNIRPNDFFSTSTDLIAVEDTHNDCGGKVLPPKFVERLSLLCKSYKIPLHVDGARIWNAAVARKVSVAEVVQRIDSVSACLSKGLGAPVGSVLLGQNDYIEQAIRIRKAVGGGMRQVGGLAAAALQALEDFDSGMLSRDHFRANWLATELSQLPGLYISPTDVDTNILFIGLDAKINAQNFCNRLGESGTLVLPRGSSTIRLVVHRDLTDSDITNAVTHFRQALSQY